jgi:hypothetical protein
MEAATYILFVLGCLGATDILVFHSVAHGIRAHPESRLELVVHSLRGPTYAILFLVVPNFTLHGIFFGCLIGVFALDLAISIVDFALERTSRQFFGGLPTGEYILHIILAMLFGALVTSVCFGAWNWAKLPTRMAYAPADVPGLLRLAMAVMAILVFLSGLEDALAAQRLGRHRRQDRPSNGVLSSCSSQ